MSERPLKTVLQGIADEGVAPGQVDLWPRVRDLLITRTAASRRGVMPSAMGRPALALSIVLAAIALSLMLIGPSRALAAVYELLGYIPGIGLVDEASGLRVLAQPAILERDEVRVTVEQGVLDSERTVVSYRVDGIPASAYPLREGDPYCNLSPDLSPELHILDRVVLLPTTATSGGWISGYQSRLVFPALPLDANQAELRIPCLNGTARGTLPERWKLALRFVPAPPGMTFFHIADVTPGSEGASVSGRGSGMGLYLERVIELQEEYILIGTFRQGEELRGSRVMGISSSAEIFDAAGRALPYETPSELDLGSQGVGVFPWAYQIAKDFTPPLTLTLRAVDVEIPVDAIIEFETGLNPPVGQEWRIDQDLNLAGYTVHVVSAVRLENGYELLLRSDPAVSYVSAWDPEHETVSGSGSGFDGEYSVSFEYEDPVPEGLLTVHIRALIARHSGPWTLTWQPSQ